MRAPPGPSARAGALLPGPPLPTAPATRGHPWTWPTWRPARQAAPPITTHTPRTRQRRKRTCTLHAFVPPRQAAAAFATRCLSCPRFTPVRKQATWRRRLGFAARPACMHPQNAPPHPPVRPTRTLDLPAARYVLSQPRHPRPEHVPQPLAALYALVRCPSGHAAPLPLFPRATRCPPPSSPRPRHTPDAPPATVHHGSHTLLAAPPGRVPAPPACPGLPLPTAQQTAACPCCHCRPAAPSFAAAPRLPARALGALPSGAAHACASKLAARLRPLTSPLCLCAPNGRAAATWCACCARALRRRPQRTQRSPTAATLVW